MIRLSTLGVVDLRAPENRVLDAVLAQPKRVALLAYLAAARPTGFHRRDRLVALFWPELDDGRARDALSQALRFLRQALGAEVVLTRGVDEVGIDHDRLWCDVVAFRAAMDDGRPGDALGLYRGDFLDGVFVEEASGFEEWVEAERAAVRKLAARGARQLAEEHDGHGAHTVAVGWGRRMVELAPDDERAFRRLFGLLERAGDRAGALQAYDDFARRLRAEYGAEPAEETRAMVEAIRRAPRMPAVAVATPPERERAVLSPDVVRAPRPLPEGVDGSLAIGSSLANGSYVIEGVLGSGGMATVYLAHDVRHERRVAVKVLKPEIAASIGTKALLREIRIAASLQHPHIVPLFDSGESDGHVFYVMPYIAGESLRGRLKREPVVPLDLALRIARDVADALAYAHRRGIVHRDIKPDNILLSGDPASDEFHAVVADFGVAKPVSIGQVRAAGQFDKTATPFGMFVGTPGYMAPEQSAGESVDSRADVYAWGIVTYEMLAGAHPFVGSAGRSTYEGELAHRPAALNASRQDVPPALVELIGRCLRAAPSERPADGDEVAHAVRGATRRSPASWLLAASRPRMLLVLAGLSIALGGAYLAAARTSRARGGNAERAASSEMVVLDTARYAIFPFAYNSDTVHAYNETERLRDAFSRWGGVALVDEFQLGEAVSRVGSRHLTTVEAQRIAAGLGAGRYVRGEIRQLGDAVRLHVVLYETRSNTRIRDTTARVDKYPERADSLFAGIADHLLFGVDRRADWFGARGGRRSLPARQAFVGAQSALQRWNLAEADSHFRAATKFDPAYAQAWLWLAHVRWWRGAPTAEWNEAAQRAAKGQDQLSIRDRDFAVALSALNRGDVVRACRLFSSLAERDLYDFAAWYSTSECLARDEAVLRDPGSPSGWRFRSSYHRSVVAYRRAVQLLPSIHRALRDGAYSALRVRLRTAGNFTRQGHDVASATSRFAAYPAWLGDTLVFVPYPQARFLSGDEHTIPATRAEAVLRQRRLFYEIAAGWATVLPESPDAQEALAIGLQLLGDPAALDTIRRARRLASDRDDRVRLAAHEVWIRVRFGLPSDLDALRAARELADSLLQATNANSISDVRPLASLAALTGRATVTARLSRHRSVRDGWGVPSLLSDVVPQLWVFAAFGGPSDSLLALETRFDRARRIRLNAGAAQRTVDTWLVRASVLAFPEHRLEVPPRSDAESGYYLHNAVTSLIAGDTAKVRRILGDVERARRRTQPADRAVDALYTEARLLQRLGDLPGAAAWLDPTLDAIASADPLLIADPMRAATLVRAMALRADIAAALGDRHTARRWAGAVTEFWSEADSFLQPLVERMRKHAG